MNLSTMRRNILKSSISLLLSLSAAAVAVQASTVTTPSFLELSSKEDKLCVHSFYVRTSSVPVARFAENTAVGIELRTSNGSAIVIPDLKAWGGMMGDGHKYFRRSNLDIFTGRGPCLRSPPCWLKVTLVPDVKKEIMMWYCDSVQVVTTGPPRYPCAHRRFVVKKLLINFWPPYLPVTVHDECQRPTREAAAVTADAGGRVDVM